jgi:hypothetical protein
MVQFPKLEYPVLAEQKLSWLKKMITPRQVLMMTMMMIVGAHKMLISCANMLSKCMK